MIETNLDDWTSENWQNLEEQFFELGVKDIWRTPIVMKKGRVAQTLHILCEPNIQSRVKELLFRETSAIGLRQYTVEKVPLKREVVNFEYEGVTISFKRVFWRETLLKYKLESTSIAQFAKEKRRGLQEAERQLTRYLEENERWQVLKAD